MQYLKLYENFLLNEGLSELKNLFKTVDNFQKLTNNDDQLLKRIIKMDPTSNLKKDSVGKYSKWLINRYFKNDTTILNVLKHENNEDDYKITDMLSLFDKHKNKLEKKNINDYKNISSLEAETDAFLQNVSNTLENNIDSDEKSNDIEIFAKLERWVIVVPKNKEASIKYGKGTKWCTARNDEQNAFKSYTNDKLYIFLDKNDSYKPKYQFHFKSNAFMDEKDHPINIKDFFNEFVDVFDKFFPKVKNKLDNEQELDETDTKYIPNKYVEKYLSYFKNPLLDILKNPELLKDEENRKYIGFKDYDIEIENDWIVVLDFKENEFEEKYELDDGIISMVDNIYANVENSLDNNTDEYQYFIQNVFDDNLRELLFKILEYENKDRPETYDDIEDEKLFKLLGDVDLSNKFWYSYGQAVSEHSSWAEKQLKIKTNDLPFLYQYHNWKYRWEFHLDIEKCLHIIVKKCLFGIESLEEMLENIDLKEIYDYEDVAGEYVYNLGQYDIEDKRDDFKKILEEKIEELEDEYGSEIGEDDTDEKVIKKVNIKTLEELKKLGLNVGQILTNKDKTIKIIGNITNGKVQIDLNGKRLMVYPKDIKMHLYQERIPFNEQKIQRFNLFNIK